jgi:hypothetical protein
VAGTPCATEGLLNEHKIEEHKEKVKTKIILCQAKIASHVLSGGYKINRVFSRSGRG